LKSGLNIAWKKQIFCNTCFKRETPTASCGAGCFLHSRIIIKLLTARFKVVRSFLSIYLPSRIPFYSSQSYHEQLLFNKLHAQYAGTRHSRHAPKPQRQRKQLQQRRCKVREITLSGDENQHKKETVTDTFASITVSIMKIDPASTENHPNLLTACIFIPLIRHICLQRSQNMV